MSNFLTIVSLLCIESMSTDLYIFTYKFCHLKIGPQVLVLGKEAQENGLATSLLLRIHRHYEHLNKEHNQTIDHLTSQFKYSCFVFMM